MQKVKIITDSTCDLPKNLVKELDITVIPLKVFMGEETFIDGVNLSTEEFYERLPALNELPRTAQPSPKDFHETYENALKSAESIISIHISRLMSGTLNSAESAKKVLPEADIRIYDSKSTSAGLALILLLAGRAAKEGKTVDEIGEIIMEGVSKLKAFGLASTLKYLQKGGRIGKAKGMLGRLLGKVPILTIEDGETQGVTSVSGRDNAIEKILEILREEGITKSSLIGLTHGNIPSITEEFKARIEDESKTKINFVNYLGPIVGTHLGPGSLFCAFIKE